MIFDTNILLKSYYDIIFVHFMFAFEFVFYLGKPGSHLMVKSCPLGSPLVLFSFYFMSSKLFVFLSR